MSKIEVRVAIKVIIVTHTGLIQRQGLELPENILVNNIQ